MYQLSRFALRLDQIEPAARHHELLGQAQDAVGDRIAVMMVVKEPAVEVALAQGRLKGFEFHVDVILINYASFREWAGEGPRILDRVLAGSVSEAVRNTSRGARSRIFMR